MKQTFLVLATTMVLVVPVGSKHTLINTGTLPLFITSEATHEALKELDHSVQLAVKSSLYSLAPGVSKSLTAGTYLVDLQMNCDAVLMVETKLPVPEKKIVEKPVENPPLTNSISTQTDELEVLKTQ